MDFEGDEAIVRKEGEKLVVRPVHKAKLLELLASWEPLGEPFPAIDDDPDLLDDVDL